MTLKSSLFSGVAVLAAVALTAGAAEAAPKHHKKAAVAAAPAASAAEVEALKAQVAALTARLDQLTQSQAKTEEAAASNEQIQTAIVTSMAAQSTAISEMPAKVQKDVITNLPKSKNVWAETTSVNGRMYFDLSHIEQKTNGVKANPTGDGFDIKRFYVGIDHKFNDTFSANITTDASFNSGTGNVEVFIKKAYLQAKVNDMLTVRAGSADMPWIPFVEDIYGYRFVEQTLTDRTKFANSADWGIHGLGKIGPYVSYAVAVVDGAGYKNPSRSSGVDVEARVSAKVQDFTVAVGGYTGKLGQETQALPSKHTAERFNVLAAYTTSTVRLGVEYFSATNWTAVTNTLADKADGYSVFGSYAFTPMVSVFGKFEEVKPRKSTVSSAKDNYFNIGINFEPVKIVDLSLVYKRDKVDALAFSTGNGTIGANGVGKNGSYDEIGLFGQLRW